MNLKLIEKLKEIAKSRYEESYGFQVFVECWQDKDWQRIFGDMEEKEGEKVFFAIASRLNEQNNSAEAEIF